jgi:serine/threonine protein kinase/dipeptidyl aminopeptidase/acylaminoacyl peptidase
MVRKTISHYEILEKLGEGGMGVVYKARDTHLDRPVAIKVLPPNRMADPDRKRRFIQEAKAASALNHPNIITIYDTDHADGLDFISMEFVPGKTLDLMIPRKGLPLGMAFHYAAQMADALAAAHHAGIIHRDLKPANVMVNDQGKVKLLDFGLAKLTETAPLGPDAETRTLIPPTEDGAIVGTVAYMSPEQAQGKHVDARSDIFSFGSVLYEMVAGRRPFEGDSKIATLAAIIERDPLPLPPGIPHDVDKLISRCLRKDPARRMQTMADLKVALEELKEESDSGTLEPAAPLTRHVRSWRLWASLAAVVALVSAGLWFGVFSRTSPRPIPAAVPLTSFPGLEAYPTFSPDGTQIAYAWNGEQQNNLDIYIQVIGSGTPLRRTTDPSGEFSPAWSPDARYLAFLRGNKDGASVVLVPPISGSERTVAEVNYPGGVSGSAWGSLLAWTPDGRWLAYPDRPSPTAGTGVFILSIETGERRRLTVPPQNAQDLWPAFSPKGDSLAFVRWGITHIGEVHVLALTSDMMPKGPPQQLTFENRLTVTPTWTADGRDILYSTGTIRSRVIRRISATGRARPVETLALLGEIVDSPAVSGPRRRLVFRQGSVDQNIWWVDRRSGLPANHPVSSSRNEEVPQFSPDGKRIVFTSDRSGKLAVWVSNKDGSGAEQLTFLNATITGCPRWSPDGNRIVFDSNAEGQYEVYVIPSKGGNPTRMTNNPANDAVASWSRDGRWIYFMSNRTGQPQIWKMPSAGGDAVQVTANGGYVALEAPDGKTLYYTRTGGASSLWKLPLQGGEETKVVDAVTFLNFSLGQKGIYFAPLAAWFQRSIEYMDFATGRTQTIAVVGRYGTTGLSVSPDERTILYGQQDQLTSDLMLVEGFR